MNTINSIGSVNLNDCDSNGIIILISCIMVVNICMLVEYLLLDRK